MVDSRKFRVWLISLGAVLALYLLYSLISKTPPIEIDTNQDFTGTFTDANGGELGDEIGMMGNIGVGTVRKAEYIHLNEQKKVDRILGFQELLHKTENEWEGKKPYMNIFRRDLGCYITADRADVRIETVAGKPAPRDAKFTGNVVAHILPENSSDIKEGFFYLDDVTFISDKSQFLTPGPVKYTSEDIHMAGKGLELIYNEQLERIELLKVFHLESVRLKSTQSPFFPKEKNKGKGPLDPNSQMPKQQPEKTVTSDDSQKVKSSPPESTQAPEKNEAEHYRCVFSKNVVIDSPEQLIFASEKLSIYDIFQAKDLEGQSDNADPNGADPVKTTTANSATDEENPFEPNSPGSPNSQAIPAQEPVDIVVTCDKGLVITPIDVPQPDTNSALLTNEQLLEAARGKLEKLEKTNGRTIFIAQNIDFSASTRDTVATGPSELTFYTGDLIRPEANEAIVPVKITAQTKAQFLPASNQALFEGDSVCTMLRQDPNSQQKYALSAQQLTVDLSKDKDKRPSASAGTIEHLTAVGGTVQLDTSKWAGKKLLGFTKLKCRRFEYDAKEQYFLATGPGVIAIDNSNISEPNAASGRFSMRRRCYAVVENFDTLKYLLETNQIIAQAKSQGLVVDYFPIVDGKYGQRVTVTAGRVVANLVEIPGGPTELSTLHATGGVEYEEKDKEFSGNELFFDALKSILTVQGDDSHPCIYNGTLVDQIEYDLKTGRVKFQIVGPGVIQRK
ncbi:MAG: hypothetical protein FVQ85_14390 [Planctomycetes bacterium]|nr:hypothetical protein [Planctomycetota bacterium]